MQKINKDDNEYIEDINPDEIYRYCETIKAGDILKGKIVDVKKDGVYVDIGSKTDGFIPAEEFFYKDLSKFFRVGEEIKVYVMKLDFNNLHTLSFRKAREIESIKDIRKAYENQEPVECKLLYVVENGFIVDIGIDAYLPYKETTKDLKEKIKNIKEFKFKVIIKEIKENVNGLSIIVSHKSYVDLNSKIQREKIFKGIKENDTVIGVVKNITSYGAFVDIGGVDALLHVSDLSWHKVDKVEKVVNIGDKIKVKVLKIDQEKEKISVSLKHLFPHPWDEIEKKYQIGEVVKGKITSITSFGIFVEIEPGIEGLVHVSEIDWKDTKKDLRSIYHLNDIVDVKVINIDKENRKISLSLKRLQENPWYMIRKKYPNFSRIKGKIEKITEFGLFIEIEHGFIGLLHSSDIYWTKEARNLKEKFRVGQEIECVILDVLPEQEKAILSIKHLVENPFNKYSEGNIVKCKVKKISKTLVVVELERDVEGIIFRKEATTDEKDENKTLSQLFQIGQEIDAVIVESNESKKRIVLSVRKLEKTIQKQLIKKYSNIEAPKLKDVLEEK